MYAYLYGDLVSKSCMMVVWQDFCMMVCAVGFIFSFIR